MLLIIGGVFSELCEWCVCSPGQTMEMNTVTVYDIQNKFIAYSAPFPSVIGVFCEWGSLYVLAGDRKVWHCFDGSIELNAFIELCFLQVCSIAVCCGVYDGVFCG